MKINSFLFNVTKNESHEYAILNSTSMYVVPIVILFMMTEYRHYFLYLAYVLHFIGAYEIIKRIYKKLIPLGFAILAIAYHYIPLYIYYNYNHYFTIKPCLYNLKNYNLKKPKKGCLKKYNKSQQKVKWRDIETSKSLIDILKINTNGDTNFEMNYDNKDYERKKFTSFVFGSVILTIPIIYYFKNDNWPYVVSMYEMLILTFFIIQYYFSYA